MAACGGNVTPAKSGLVGAGVRNTPPFGISAYVVKSTLDDQRITLQDIFAGAFPFVICMALVVLLLVFAPQLSLMFK